MSKAPSKTDTSALAAALSGKNAKVSRMVITPADNGYTMDTDMDSGNGPYIPSKKSVFPDLEGVKDHLDQHMPQPKKVPAKRKIVDTGKAKTKKVKVVDLGKKGSFTIKKPGALRKKAQAAGESTKQFARAHDKGNSETARESRAAMGLMAMGK